MTHGCDTVQHPFRRLSAYLMERFGEKVHKVCLHCGFSCPNRDGTLATRGCAFCLDQALEPVGFDSERTIAEQLEHGMAYISRRHRCRRFIAYYQDHSATHASSEELAAALEPALRTPQVVGVAVSTRPDCLPAEVLGLLQLVARHKELWVELGLQIADDPVLADLNRCHTVADFSTAVRSLHERAVRVCGHVIIGLPGATSEAERRTARLLADLDVWGVKLHAFHVLEGTEMARRYRTGGLPILSRDEHCERVVDFVERLPPTTVIHRVTAESPPRLTLAPRWTTNKLAAYDAVVAAFAARSTWQGRLWRGRPAAPCPD